MTADRAIAKYLRDRIADVRLDDVRAVVRLLNEMEESLGLSIVGATRSLLRATAEEGAPLLVKELARGPDALTNLKAIAAVLAEKRHLDPRAARHAVRIWAAALDVTERPADADLTSLGGRTAPEGDGEQVMNNVWQILLAFIAAGTAVAIGYGCFRETIVEGARRIVWAIVTAPFLFILRALVLTFIASWPVRKLWEGVCQIVRFFDRISGAVYITVLVLGVGDAVQWLPYGLRDIAAQMPKRTRHKDALVAVVPSPSSDSERAVHFAPPSVSMLPPLPSVSRLPAPIAITLPSPKSQATRDEVKNPIRPVMQDDGQVAPSSALVERSPRGPVEPKVSRQEPGQIMPPRSQQHEDAGEVRANVRSTETHVLEFHVHKHGNDPLHVTVQGRVEAGDVVSATWRGKPIRLQVRRPLTSTSHLVAAPRWLAVLLESPRLQAAIRRDDPSAFYRRKYRSAGICTATLENVWRMYAIGPADRCIFV
jgi:hypothetical protein